MTAMSVRVNNDPQEVIDKHFSVKCPHCGIQSALSAVSIPRFEQLVRFQPQCIGIGYYCNNCKEPVFLRFQVRQVDPTKFIIYSEPYEEVEHVQETFEYQYLPAEVAADLKEALTCFSNQCFNAFAAMCRRCIQSSLMNLGATGKDRVQNQLDEIKEVTDLDDETYNILKEIIISGHDGSHPHLPKLSAERAEVLLVLIKDVLTQLFVRKAKIQEAAKIRRQDIDQMKNSTQAS